MFRRQNAALIRRLERQQRVARASRPRTVRSEVGLGTVGGQARRVAGALTVLVTLGVVAGCFGSPVGLDCDRHGRCEAESACGECVEVPGCGPLRVDRALACAESCPLPFECSVSSSCPPVLRCEGLVPGHRHLAENEPPGPPSD